MKQTARSSEIAPTFCEAGELGVTMIEKYRELLCSERMERISV